jgi:DNA polymerase
VDDEEPRLWTPDLPFPTDLALAVLEGAEFRGWNALGFERIVWREALGKRRDLPTPDLEQWQDTMVEAGAMGLPRGLGDAARVVGVSEQKDDPGHLFVLRMAKPRSRRGNTVAWWDVPERLQRLYAYCQQDVRTERALARVVRRLTPGERANQLMDARMNDRGVCIDAPLVRDLRVIADEGLRRAGERLYVVTDGRVDAVTKVADLAAWVQERGVPCDGVRKAVVRDLLAGDVPVDVRAALEQRQEAGKASVGKLRAALDARSADGRARGLLQFFGADTGRWSARRVQPQNFPRGEVNYAPYLTFIRARDYDGLDLLAPPLMVVAATLRGMFVAAPGHRLVVGDYAQIEARVLAWCAGQDDLTALFRAGQSPYPPMGEAIYGLTPGTITSKSDPRYKMGKDTVLGCGYGMGAEKFRAQIIEKEGHDVGEELAERSVHTYREMMPAVVKLWHDVGAAAMAAVQTPGSVQRHRGGAFTFRGGYLYLLLPSGRPLCYARPQIRPRRTPWGELRDAVVVQGRDPQTKRWVTYPVYGGLLVENIVQALARDIMADGMRRLEMAGYPPVLTVHDEIVAEVPDGHGNVDEFIHLATDEVPAWAAGCPVDLEAWEGERYRK